MDLLEAFLNGESIKRSTISGGSTNGRLRMEYERPNYIEDKVPEQTKKYAKPFVDQLKNEVWKVSIMPNESKCNIYSIGLGKWAPVDKSIGNSDSVLNCCRVQPFIFALNLTSE